MPSLDRQSTEAHPDNRRDAERIQLAVRAALAEIEAIRRRLLFDVSGFEPGEPVVVDGEPAILEGRPLDLVGWLRDSVEDCCEHGAFVDLQIELWPDGEADPLERVAQYTREHRGMRARQRARRERREGDAPDGGT